MASTSTREHRAPIEFSIASVAKANDVTFIRANRSSRMLPIFEAVKKLNPGQVLPISADKEILADPKEHTNFRTTIGNYVRKLCKDLPHIYYVGRTATGCAIKCEAVPSSGKPAVRRGPKSAAKK